MNDRNDVFKSSSATEPSLVEIELCQVQYKLLFETSTLSVLTAIFQV